MDNNELLRQQKQIYIKHLIKILKEQIKYNNLINQYNKLYDKQGVDCKISATAGFGREILGNVIQPVKVREAVRVGHKLGLLNKEYSNLKKLSTSSSQYKKNDTYKRIIKKLTKKVR